MGTELGGDDLQDRLEKLREKNDALRAENHKLRLACKNSDSVAARYEALQAVKLKLEKELQGTKAQLAEQRLRNGELEAELLRESHHRALRANAQCDLRLGKELFAWRKKEEAEGRCKETVKDADSRLGLALQGAFPAVLLLDAHNVLFGMPSRYNPARGHSMKESDKRKALVKDVRRLVEAVASLRCWLVFDGDDTASNCEVLNVRVMYSGGSGFHRADRVLVDTIRFCKTSEPEVPVFLVSDDKELRKQALKVGAEVLSVLEFGPYLPSTRG